MLLEQCFLRPKTMRQDSMHSIIIIGEVGWDIRVAVPELHDHNEAFVHKYEK